MDLSGIFMLDIVLGDTFAERNRFKYDYHAPSKKSNHDENMFRDDEEEIMAKLRADRYVYMCM